MKHYQAAVDILSGQLKGKERAVDPVNTNDDEETRRSIVRALIGMVEIWMDPSYNLWSVSVAFCASAKALRRCPSGCV